MSSSITSQVFKNNLILRNKKKIPMVTKNLRKIKNYLNMSSRIMIHLLKNLKHKAIKNYQIVANSVKMDTSVSVTKLCIR